MSKAFFATAVFAASALVVSPALADPAYLVATISVTDWDAYQNKYASVAIPAIVAAGGEVLVADAEVKVVEGAYAHNWTVVVKFPSEADAIGFYGSPAYEAVIPERHNATDVETSVLLLAAQFVPAK